MCDTCRFFINKGFDFLCKNCKKELERLKKETCEKLDIELKARKKEAANET